MPVKLIGVQQRFPEGVKKEDLGYKYPFNLDLVPGSDTHDSILQMVFDRAQESYEVMQSRHESWEKINRNLTAYIPLDDEEQKIKDADDRKPVRIVLPRSYATLEVLLTYWMAAFGERPYFRYAGVGPEDDLGAMLLELHIDRQMYMKKAILALHTMWRDSFIHGFGALGLSWEVESKIRKYRGRDSFWDSLSGMFRRKSIGMSTEDVNTFEGTVLHPIDPFLYLPDINKPIHEVQGGEYVGWLDQTNLMSILSQERNSPESFFNGKYLKDIAEGRSSLLIDTRYGEGTGRKDRYNSVTPTRDLGHPIDVIRMPMTIIPADEGLGDGEYPEKWMFSVAADSVVIQAEPLGFSHGMYPIAVCAPDFDGHTTSPISRLEVVYGLQETIDFLITSHISNVRKSVNNMFVVDPMIVNINDFESSKAGLLARIRKRYWGSPDAVNRAVKQLDVRDVTANNLRDIAILADEIKDSTAAVDSLAGKMRQGGERVTATETSGARMSALSRLERAALITSVQAHMDISIQVASNAVELTDEDYFVRIHGRNSEELARILGKNVGDRIPISPDVIDVNFDIDAGDGSIPSAINADALIRTLQAVSPFPETQSVLDIPKIIQIIARSSGVKNVQQLLRTVSPVVVDDEEAEEASRKGDLVPIGEIKENGRD